MSLQQISPPIVIYLAFLYLRAPSSPLSLTPHDSSLDLSSSYLYLYSSIIVITIPIIAPTFVRPLFLWLRPIAIAVTVYQRPHDPIPQAEQEKVRAQIQQWLDDGVSVPTSGHVPHLNQLTLAARRDLEGNILKNRLCLDPRNLNSHLLDCDNFPLPNITKILEKAAGHKYFSTIDLRQA